MFSIYRLPNQLPNEKVLHIIRKDIFILFKTIFLFIGFLILPLLFFYFMIVSRPDLLTGEISYPLIILGVSAYYLFIWVFFFFSFIDYYLDVWLITNERIIDIEQRGFFSRVISEQKLFRIQDVTSEAHGVVATIFGYGDVHIQTAGTKQRFKFHEIPNPHKVRDTITKLVEKNKHLHHRDNKEE